MTALRRSIAAVALVGTLVFGAAFVASFAVPGFVERVTRVAIQVEVERRTHKKIEALQNARLVTAARRVQGENAARIGQLHREVLDGLPARVAAVVARMRDLDCECRKKIERAVEFAIDGQVVQLTQLNERLEMLIRSQYMEVSEKLTFEFRVFTGANTLVMLLLGLAVLVRRRADIHLLPTAAVLTGSAVTVGWLYLFKQDWLHTILFSDYVGWSYFGYLALALVLLGDLFFNRARVTTLMLNGAASVVGSAVFVLPC